MPHCQPKMIVLKNGGSRQIGYFSCAKWIAVPGPRDPTFNPPRGMSDQDQGAELPLSVIPGRRKAASPESITMIGSMDSGLAPSGAPRNDGYFSGERKNKIIFCSPRDGRGALRAYVFPNNNSTERGDAKTSTQARRLHAPGLYSHRRLALSRRLA